MRLLADGRWIHEGPENAGMPVEMGQTAVVRVGGINLVLTSVKSMPGDLQQLKPVGIAPARQKIIVVKAAVRWRAEYSPIVKHSIDVGTPGSASGRCGGQSSPSIRTPIGPNERWLKEARVLAAHLRPALLWTVHLLDPTAIFCPARRWCLAGPYQPAEVQNPWRHSWDWHPPHGQRPLDRADELLILGQLP